MKRRGFLGILGAAIGVYAVEPTLDASQPRTHVEQLAIQEGVPPAHMQSFVLRNDGETPMVIAYKSSSREPIATRAQQILAKRPYQTEAILLPSEELTITAAPMKGLSAT